MKARSLLGFAKWYCWLHNITEKTSINTKRSTLGIFRSLGIEENEIPTFLKTK